MIHIVDELRVRPGRLRAVRTRLGADYLPGAEARGMTLVGSWIAPAVELRDQPTHLIVLWSVPDVPSWWAMRRVANTDDAVRRFWEELAPDLEGRSRRMLADAPLRDDAHSEGGPGGGPAGGNRGGPA